MQKEPLREEDEKILNTVPLYKRLSDGNKKILSFKIKRFKTEKQFIGVGIEINNEIKTLISFFACLPTLGYKYFCYPSLNYIYIYPHTVILNNEKNTNGVISKEQFLIEGEAVGDSVVIIWNKAKREIYHNTGRNVIIHEFAHELDFEEGAFDGIPPIEKSLYGEWTKILFKEYEKFRKKILLNRFLGKYSLLDSYAATNKAEFFAVLSEYYFSHPEILKKHFPDIYRELKIFYKIEI
ncbi:M90 family metallopeptidase [Nautilia sp.]